MVQVDHSVLRMVILTRTEISKAELPFGNQKVAACSSGFQLPHTRREKKKTYICSNLVPFCTAKVLFFLSGLSHPTR